MSKTAIPQTSAIGCCTLKLSSERDIGDSLQKECQLTPLEKLTTYAQMHTVCILSEEIVLSVLPAMSERRIRTQRREFGVAERTFSTERMWYDIALAVLLTKADSVAQRLNVLQRVRFASSLTAALLDGLSEQPVGYSRAVCDRDTKRGF